MDQDRFQEHLKKETTSVAERLHAMQSEIEKEQGIVKLSEDLTVIKIFINEAVEKVQAGGKSRARSLVVTKLEEARMWIDEELRLS